MDNRFRNYSKGKSFKFSKWNELDTYNNDEFIQDWVVYEGKLYVCIKTNTNVIPLESKEWEFVNNVGKDGITPLFQITNDFWEVSYDDGKTWRILSKAKGEDGKDGINGTDGITPSLKIENDFWYVSYNNGVDWERLSKSVGEDGINGNTPTIKVENDFWWVSYDNGLTWEELMEVEHAGETNTESVEVKNTIQVVDGPLSKLLNDAGITEISKGTNLQNLLLSLFCKRNWPTDIKSVSGTLYSNSGINSFSITASPDRLMEPGETVYFSATQGSVKGYGTTNSSVTGLSYGYSTSNNNIKEGDNTSFSKSWKVTTKDSEYTLTLRGGASDVSKTGSGVQTISNYPIVAQIGNNICTAVSSGSVTYSGTIDSIPVYYGVSNLGDTSDEYKSTFISSQTKEVTSSGNTSSTKTIVCAYPCFHNHSGSTLLDSATIKKHVDNTVFEFTDIPSGKPFIFEYPSGRTVTVQSKISMTKYKYYTNISGKEIVENVNSATSIPSSATIKLSNIPAEENFHFKLQFPDFLTLKSIKKLNTNSGAWETLNTGSYQITSGHSKDVIAYKQFETLGGLVGSGSYEFAFETPTYKNVSDYSIEAIKKTINGTEYDYSRLSTTDVSKIVSRKITLSKSTSQ